MNPKEIEQALRDYHWMVREIARLRGYLDGGGVHLIGKYGLDAIMPKTKGDTRDPVAMEVVRRERQWRRIERLEQKVSMIQQRINIIQDEREKTVLDCLLDGMSMAAISRHMGLSDRHIRRLKDNIVMQMSETPDLPRMSAMSGMSVNLRREKECS